MWLTKFQQTQRKQRNQCSWQKLVESSVSVWWVEQQLNPHPVICSPPAAGQGRVGWAKVRKKLMGQDKDSLMSEAKTKQEPMQRESLTTSQCPASPWARTTLEKVPTLFHSWAWCYTVWDIPVVWSGQLSQPCPFPASISPSAYSLGDRERERLRWCWHSSVTAKTLVCYLLWFGYESKTQHHGGCHEEINSIPTTPSTGCELAATVSYTPFLFPSHKSSKA